MSSPHFPPWTPAACICVDLVSDNDCPVHGPKAYVAAVTTPIGQPVRPSHPVQAAREDCQNEIPLSHRLDHDGAQYRAEQRKIEFVKPGVEITYPWADELNMLKDVIDEQNAYIERLEEDNDTYGFNLDRVIEVLQIARTQLLNDSKEAKFVDEVLKDLDGYGEWTDEELDKWVGGEDEE